MTRKTACLILIAFSLAINLSGSMPDDKDMLYEYRIAELNAHSPVSLEYNPEVRKYIDLYTGPRRNDMARIIGLSTLYFPIFDEILDRNKLPLELKYLTVIESALNPLATSKSGAVGLWQFLLNSAKLFDLQVTSVIDERCDPYKSTEAAARYLNYLYSTFHDWQLVMASYNGGPGEVRKAIERCHGVTDYWSLRPYLSDQAKNYVPAFVAAFYLLNYYGEHGIVPEIPPIDYQHMDTLHIHYSVAFSQISTQTGIDQAVIRMLNPVYKLDYIPESNPYALLILPADKISMYLQKETQILGYSPPPDDYNRMVANAASTQGRKSVVHIVKAGESTHKIAMNYHVTLENIRAWNHLDSSDLRVGQRLVIWVVGD